LTDGARVDSATNVDDVFQPNLPLLAGIPSIWGLFNPVQLSDYYDFWKAYVPGRGSRLYDLLGARYLVAKKDTPLDAKFLPALGDDRTLNVYANPSALPRAFAVAQSAGGTHDEALATIRSPAFDPSKQAVLEGGPALNAAGSGSTAPGAITPAATSSGASGGGTASAASGGSAAVVASVSAAGPWPATTVQDRGDVLTFDIAVPQQAALVVSTPYYPGWSASLDGQKAQLYRADFVFQGLVLPAGSHHVALRFEPPLFRIGAVVSVIGWLAALGAMAYSSTARGRYS
ncbi:MAG: YfhO family protein, partial [Chloroflexi bacterium]|nr:YfhO family protein [Chloroflexota bacterium]